MAEVPADEPELAALLQARAETSSRERKAAIACFLAGGEGWRKALDRLGGAFAAGDTGRRAEDA